jgi:hypothetical protein
MGEVAGLEAVPRHIQIGQDPAQCLVGETERRLDLAVDERVEQRRPLALGAIRHLRHRDHQRGARQPGADLRDRRVQRRGPRGVSRLQLVAGQLRQAEPVSHHRALRCLAVDQERRRRRDEERVDGRLVAERRRDLDRQIGRRAPPVVLRGERVLQRERHALHDLSFPWVRTYWP